LKGLEAQRVKVVFLAEDCDHDQYKETVRALAESYKVPVVDIPSWIDLKDYCKLGLLSSTIRQIAEEKGKEPKIKPRCSSAAIVDWGEDSEARKFLEEDLLNN
jgi:ribosomal protein L7Ae-like RNA K-turn-binding protein